MFSFLNSFYGSYSKEIVFVWWNSLLELIIFLIIMENWITWGGKDESVIIILNECKFRDFEHFPPKIANFEAKTFVSIWLGVVGVSVSFYAICYELHLLADSVSFRCLILKSDFRGEVICAHLLDQGHHLPTRNEVAPLRR